MSLIAPLSLLFGLLALPIVVLYMLRLRRREVDVSSTMLWRQLLRDREANAPWQRLRRNLLMLLQLVVLALLVFALARPFLPVSTVTQGSLVVLLDGSASMLTQEGDVARFELAQREVERLIGDMNANAHMTLILVGNMPQVLVSASGDRSRLRQALANAQASPETADWPAAFALAAGAAQGFEDGTVALVSDGGVPDELPALPVETIYVPVGIAQENLGISALAMRRGTSGPQLFAAVTNYGTRSQQRLFNLSVDGQLFDARRIDVPAGESTNLTWDLDEDISAIEANLSPADQDSFAQDDVAWVVYEGGRRNRVLLVTEGNRFLETALSVLPAVELFKVTPDAPWPVEGQEPFDLYVFDAALPPAAIPSADLLIIDPPAESMTQGAETGLSLGIGGIFTDTEVVRVDDSPVLRFVDWGNVNVRQAKAIEAPGTRPLVMAAGGPLLISGEQGGRRIIMFTFSLQDSDLPLQIAFPILMANIMDWLNPDSALLSASGMSPGEPVRIGPDPGAEAVIVRKPDGSQWTSDVDEATVVFPETDQPGIYELLLRDASDQRPAGLFAVNLFSPMESGIAPALAVRLGSNIADTSVDEDIGQRELWPWLAVLALIVLLIEWWIYHRGARLPSRGDWQSLSGGRGG